jgi:hypothetical protein
MNIAQLLGLATAGAMVAAEVSRKKQNKSAPKKKTPECTPCAASAYVQNLKSFSGDMRGRG